MAARNAERRSRNTSIRRYGVVMGGALGAFVAAAAMATGSAAPAKADFEDLLDPIIQPLLTSLTDSVAVFDPAAALDLTSWGDSLLASFSSLDLALPAAAEPASAAASSAEPAAALSSVSIPITIQEATEPTVGATVDGAGSTLLVDTGSSGLVVPLTTLDGGSTNFLTELETLSGLGSPTSFGEGGYSSGTDYIYLTYNDVSVDYDSTTGTDVATTTPVEVEVYSWDPSDFTSYFTNDAFQNFDTSNDVTGILGIGTTGTGGVGESPIEAAGYQGATVDLVGSNPVLTFDAAPDTSGTALTATGSSVSGLTETVTTSSGTAVGTPTTVSDDLDTGGVYGTLPSSISSSSLAQGDIVTVKEADGSVLYTYTIGTDEIAGKAVSQAPDITSGTSIDSGIEPLFGHSLSIDYSNNDLYLH